MTELEQLYQQVIMDHARLRHGSGLLADFDGESFQVNPTCGDEVRLRVRLAYDGEPTVAAIGWEGQGCSISQASLSLMHDLTAGHSLREVEDLGELFRQMMHSRGDFPEEKADELEDASALVGVSKFPARVKCALLGWMALRGAIAQALAEPTEEQ